MSAAQRQELLDHARDEAPNECCGILWMRDGELVGLERAENPRASPYGYELDPKSLLRANDLDDEGMEVGVYHSHPRSAAEPSQTDINLATYPHWTYVIVSLAQEPAVRAWWIEEGSAREREIELT
jgi:[CysO sulfur-carrier protein]-S-L-cysteine hydrolase